MTLLGFDKYDLRFIVNMAKMMLRDRYLGSALGGAWAIINPVLLLCLFTFIFGFVFRSKLPGAETTLGYAMWLIAGYGPWIALTESLMSGTLAVASSASMIKNLSFKTECLPIAATLTGCVSLVVSQVFLVILLLADGRPISIELVIIPYVVLLQFVMIGGLSLFLGALNVFLRDLALVLPNLLLVLLFMSPILYPITVFPEILHPYIAYNPFAILADGYRQPFIFGQFLEWERFTFLTVFSFALFILGLWFFRKLKPFFDTRL